MGLRESAPSPQSRVGPAQSRPCQSALGQQSWPEPLGDPNGGAAAPAGPPGGPRDISEPQSRLLVAPGQAEGSRAPWRVLEGKDAGKKPRLGEDSGLGPQPLPCGLGCGGTCFQRPEGTLSTVSDVLVCVCPFPGAPSAPRARSAHRPPRLSAPKICDHSKRPSSTLQTVTAFREQTFCFSLKPRWLKGFGGLVRGQPDLSSGSKQSFSFL